MVPKRAGGPGDFLGRLQRLRSIDSEGVSVDAFAFHDAVLRWQVARNPSAKSLAEETRQAIESLESVAPEPMHGAASVIDAALVEEWLANREVGASVSMWLRIGSAPVLEAVAQSFVISADWTESDLPRVSRHPSGLGNRRGVGRVHAGLAALPDLLSLRVLVAICQGDLSDLR